jgi:hypothetical protein
MKAIVLMTLAAMGYAVDDLPKNLKELQARRKKSHRNLIPAAAAHLMVEANLRIITEAAMGEREVYGRFLTLQRDFHQIMAGGSNGGKNGHGNGHGAPFASSFVPQDPAPASPPPPPEPEGVPIVVDGKEY